MSKGNIILGTARGKVGDVVQYRRLGEQGTRVYVKEVSNPKSQSQSAQRLKLNPAQKFYQGFQEILNHSWQSVPYGMRSYAYFLKQAMKSTTGPYVTKGNTEIIPWSYPVSHGSLQSFGVVRASFERVFGDVSAITASGQLHLNMVDTTFSLPADWVSNVPTQMSDFSFGDFCKLLLSANSDLKNGDQITILAMSVDCQASEQSYGYKVSSINNTLNTVCRYKRLVIDTSSTANYWTLDPFLKFPMAYNTAGGGQGPMTNSFRAVIDLTSFTHAGLAEGVVSCPVALAIIVSRYEDSTWMRSSSTMMVMSEIVSRYGSSTAANSAINSYAAEQSIALTSSRYLNNAKKEEAYAVTYSGDVLADGTTPKITTEAAKATDGGSEIPVVLGYNSLTQTNEVITDNDGYVIVPVGTPNGTLQGLSSLDVPSTSEWTRVAKVGGSSGSETFTAIKASELRRVAAGTWGTNNQYYTTNNINIL